MADCIVSSTPGRIRLRHTGLHNAALAQKLEAAMRQTDGVRSCTHNRAASSMVVLFDPRKTTPHALALCAAPVLEVPAQPKRHTPQASDKTREPSQHHHHRKPRRTRRMRINKTAKAVMLGSLTSSLVLAAVRQSQWHAITGGVFVAALGVHLLVHKRHILH